MGFAPITSYQIYISSLYHAAKWRLQHGEHSREVQDWLMLVYCCLACCCHLLCPPHRCLDTSVTAPGRLISVRTALPYV
jgi:hypothetical protein